MLDFFSQKNSDNKNESFYESCNNKMKEDKKLIRKKDDRFDNKLRQLSLNTFKNSREQR